MKKLLFNRPVIYGIAMYGFFLFGRWSAPLQTVTQVKEVVVHQVRTIVKNKDGSSTTTIVTDRETKKKDVTSAPKPNLNVSALAGVDVTSKFAPVYGVHVTKQVLGPVTVGAYGLTTGIVGVSLGVTF